MIPCVIESPFRGANKAEEMRNRAYLDKCIRWCVLNGYTPYASHKMLVDALSDNTLSERNKGIKAGLGTADFILCHPLSRVFFFNDYGWSEGMEDAHRYHTQRKRRIIEQKVGKL